MNPIRTLASVAFAATLALAADGNARAESITNVTLVNDSTPNTLVDDPARVREFITEGSLIAPPSTSGDSASFVHRMAWGAAHQVSAGGPTVALLFNNLVEYSLSFTVDDPLSRGYELDIDSLFRGYLTAHWEANSGSGANGVFSAGTLMAASFDSGSGASTVTSLSTTIGVANATNTTPDVNLLVERSGSFAAGHFVGTRTFTLSYGTVGSNTIAALQNFNTGEAALRFGAELTSPRFDVAGYPGADGEPASALGHFITATATFDPVTTPVPEPSTWALMLAGLGAFWLRRQRRDH